MKPDDFPWIPLRKIVHVLSGFAFKSSEYAESGHFLVRIGNVQSSGLVLDKPKYVVLNSRTQRFELHAGDILTSLTGNIGRVAVVEERHLPVALNQRVAKITPISNQEISAEYLYYFLSSQNFRDSLNASSHGVAQKNVSPKSVGDILIPLPELKAQKRIVAILDEAFAGIDAAMANTEKNLANARELFESYLNSVFSQSSSSWTQTTIGGILSKGVIEKPTDGNHGEIHPKKADFVQSGIPFIMAADLVNGTVNQTDCNFISRGQADSLRKGFAINGDVLLSHKGTIGRSAILETELDYVMLTPQVTYYRVKNTEILSKKFLYYAFHSPRFSREMARIAGAGSTRAYIGITKQLELPIAFPPMEAQERYTEIFGELSRESRRLEQLYKTKLSALKELKQSLLQKAFSGELTAQAGEPEVDEAVA
ncbi:restriction endonuclease subunit S [Marinobacter sp.]|uniref:restriction endonuclease subunit S n=1 Tax=Marinobacter sp. TaxID=50741 RepID=UPI00356A3F5C